MSGAERIAEVELQAYVDGQLDTARRVEVEAYLERHPDEAAAVMENLRLRDEIRLFLEDDAALGPAPPRTRALGRRLARAFLLRSLGPPLRTALAAAALLALGWFGHAWLGGDVDVQEQHPADRLADDAVQAFRAMQLRLVLTAAGAGPSTAPGSDRPLPLPADYRRLAEETFPWDGGTATLEVFAGPRGDNVLLLTAAMPKPGVEHPEAWSVGGVTAVSWQSGRTAYALSGDAPASDLLSLARTFGSGPTS